MIAFIAGVCTGASVSAAAAAILHVLHWKKIEASAKAEQQRSIVEGANILPDLVQVHSAISGMADRVKQLSDLQHLLISQTERNRQYMFVLMPIWKWDIEDGPVAEEFWKLAHAVARDQNRDDWIAPHVTLHSRSKNLNGLAAKFVQLVSEFGDKSWKELLSTLSDQNNWILDEDTNHRKPSAPDHFVLHKAKIDLPAPFRKWLEINQDVKTLQPRKQDRQLAEAIKENELMKGTGLIPVAQKFHISLYSFRAARKEGSFDACHPQDGQTMVVRSTSYDRKRAGRADSYITDEPRMAHHEIPDEIALQQDLALADWMLVLVSPGWTGSPAVVPKVLAAVRLSDLADGVLVRQRF